MSIRLAIVDDHRLVREGLKAILATIGGFEVVGESACGADVLSLVESSHPDVLLLDIALPDADGLTILSDLRIRFPETRVLMLSMHSEPEYAAAAVERGAAGLVGKDGSPEALLDAIRLIAAGGTLPVEKAMSPRETEILGLIARGQSNEAIADHLGVSVKTIAGHVERVMRKVGIHTRAGLVAHGRRLNL